MNVTQTPLAGVLLIETVRFQDPRGYFAETWDKNRYGKEGITVDFVQDNISCSKRGVLRGLHFQNPYPQAKLIHVLQGAAFDVVVDLRKKSSTFGKWWGIDLSAENHRQVFIPTGFAHGFLSLAEDTVLSYKCSDFYHPETGYTIRWDDPDIGIRWPVKEPHLSDKDAAGLSLAEWLKKSEAGAF